MKITNTEKQERGIFDGMPESIEAQEKTGQQEIVNSSQLPMDMMHDSKKVLESMGVVFNGVSKDDELFQDVDLPTGWHIKPTDHSMHSDLVDDKGRKVAGIFYKAAYYDRKAHLNLIHHG